MNNATYGPLPWDSGLFTNGQTAIFDANGGLVATMEAGSQARRDSDAAAIVAMCEAVKALRRAVPWLGKMIADKAHLNSVAPNDCVGALQQAEAALAKLGLRG